MQCGVDVGGNVECDFQKKGWQCQCQGCWNMFEYQFDGGLVIVYGVVEFFFGDCVEVIQVLKLDGIVEVLGFVKSCQYFWWCFGFEDYQCGIF